MYLSGPCLSGPYLSGPYLSGPSYLPGPYLAGVLGLVEVVASHYCYRDEQISPLQKDPKQQELRTHLRPRLDVGPYVKDSLKASFDQGPYYGLV